MSESRLIKLKDIDQPKRTIRDEIKLEGIEELATSIKELGLINEINLKKVGKRYEIIAGHRRYLAHEKLGLKQIRATIEERSQEETEEVKIAENIIREDLNPIELANVLLYMQNKLKISLPRMAKRLGKTVRWVEQKTTLLKLPAELIQALKDRLISEKVAKELANIDEEIERKRLLSYAIANGVTWKVVNEWVTNYKLNRGIEEQIINKEVSQAEIQQRTIVKVKCMLCGKEEEITEMRYEPCHSECYFELMYEIQKRGKQ